MNPEVKAKWLAALRSGEYKQAKNNLRQGERFCCLGVLCDLHSKETGQAWEWEFGLSGGRWVYLGYGGRLPEDVVSWSGMPSTPSNYLPDMQVVLARLNDDTGSSFALIADYIENEL